MIPPQTKYAKSGALNIAYQVVGQGSFDLVYVPGFVSNIEFGRHRGVEIDTAGDGFFATFDGPARAVVAGWRSAIRSVSSVWRSAPVSIPASARPSRARRAGSR